MPAAGATFPENPEGMGWSRRTLGGFGALLVESGVCGIEVSEDAEGAGVVVVGGATTGLLGEFGFASVGAWGAKAKGGIV